MTEEQYDARLDMLREVKKFLTESDLAIKFLPRLQREWIAYQLGLTEAEEILYYAEQKLKS